MMETENYVDLTNEDKNTEDLKVLLKSEKFENREEPINVISDEEWIRNLSEQEKNWYEKNSSDSQTPTNDKLHFGKDKRSLR